MSIREKLVNPFLGQCFIPICGKKQSKAKDFADLKIIADKGRKA